MTVTVASFRAAFPEFASMTTYPDPEVTFWLDLGLLLLNVERWGNLFDYGHMLFMAHNLALQFNSKKASASGGNPGNVQGPQTAGAVDKVSYSRNPGLAMDPKNGHWNLTIYGLQYINLVNMVGAGPLQVGVPLGGAAADYYPGAWPGPIMGPY